MRKRITYANVAATMALVFSMSGGALAAKHYLISSTKQINPKVLKKLKGATGKTGSAGKEGSPGKEGAPGKEGPKGELGPAGTYPGVLPSGKSETGAWSTSDTETPAYATISFVDPLAKAPTIHLINAGESPPAGCSGNVMTPQASSGNLCVFATFLYNSEYDGSFDPGENNADAGVHGAIVYLNSKSAGHFDGAGTWAVTG